MLNYRLAAERGLSQDDRDALLALHDAVDAMVGRYNRWPEYYRKSKTGGPVASPEARKAIKKIRKHRRKRLRQNIRTIEFMMQDYWGFERDESRHTHIDRFIGL